MSVKKFKKVFIIITIGLIFLVIYGVYKTKYNEKEITKTINVNLTIDEKVEDFQYMYNILLENYPYFDLNKRVNNINWITKKDEFIREIKKLKMIESSKRY